MYYILWPLASMEYNLSIPNMVLERDLWFLHPPILLCLWPPPAPSATIAGYHSGRCRPPVHPPSGHHRRLPSPAVAPLIFLSSWSLLVKSAARFVVVATSSSSPATAATGNQPPPPGISRRRRALATSARNRPPVCLVS
jgi:hypothetical protein